MRAIRAELRGDDTELDGQKFDVIVCAAAYHHFSDVKEMTRILVSFLKPGGSLLVADIVKDENRGGPELLEHFHHVVAHKSGFSEPEMRDTFETGGLGAFEFGTVTRAKLHGDDVDFFLAKGTKV
ncbi:hypothetical protein PHLCEN_2v10828 [Hermanssonia centrifuga]|uniref:Methyltransferase domain-containing protein n=1 Tax=Hermanssonia centrifuga TaxID=98765 RepID=A0A2R6NLM7_9APHY|nr:hypothetical protein PHLCEN_2v10828 [Hermanssonia centrifuga]